MLEDNADIKNNCLPYMFSNCYFGPEHKNSAFQMEYSWITGSVAWYSNTIESYMVGVRATYNGLEVNPHLPGFEEVEYTRQFRGATYEFEIKNPEAKLAAETIQLIVDGESIDGNIVPDFADGKTHHVVCVIG